MSLENKSDSELMELYKNGEIEAFEFIYHRYAKRIYNFFLKFIDDLEDANTLLQTTFYEIHKTRKTYNSGFALSTWIFTIAKNVLKDELKKKNEIVPIEKIDEPVSKENPEDMIERVELEKAIHNALNCLPEDQKRIIVLSKYENMKYKEIAKILKTTTGAVKVNAHRAYKRLKEYLKRFIK